MSNKPELVQMCTKDAIDSYDSLTAMTTSLPWQLDCNDNLTTMTA